MCYTHCWSVQVLQKDDRHYLSSIGNIIFLGQHDRKIKITKNQRNWLTKSIGKMEQTRIIKLISCSLKLMESNSVYIPITTLPNEHQRQQRGALDKPSLIYRPTLLWEPMTGEIHISKFHALATYRDKHIISKRKFIHCVN